MDFKKYFSTGHEYLEIGPLDNPRLKRPEYNVYYLDYNDTKTVKDIYKNSYAKMDKIVDIDFPTYGRSYKETTNGKLFDGVYSSHMIEHTTDLIGHFKDVSSVLKDGGRYFVVLPDKTHYADYFRQTTTFREVYSAYLNDTPSTLLAGAVVEATLNVNYTDDTSAFHNGEVTLLSSIMFDSENIKWANKVYDSLDPHSKSQRCHVWTFDYISILEILRDCLRYKLIPFCVEEGECTSNENNFNIYLVLKKNSEILSDDMLRLREIIKLEACIERLKHLKSPLNYLIESIHGRRIFIYGAGKYGKMIYSWIKQEGGDASFVVSDDQNIDCDEEYEIKRISDIKIEADDFFVIAVVNFEIKKEMETILKGLSLRKWYDYVTV